MAYEQCLHVLNIGSILQWQEPTGYPVIVVKRELKSITATEMVSLVPLTPVIVISVTLYALQVAKYHRRVLSTKKASC